jgi:hypothetical protein
MPAGIRNNQTASLALLEKVNSLRTHKYLYKYCRYKINIFYSKNNNTLLINSRNTAKSSLTPLKLLLIATCTQATLAIAEQDQSYEFLVWTRSWSGTLGNKQVQVSLNRTADKLSGSYCYLPCRPQTRYQLLLTGKVEGENAELLEHDRDNRTASTGQWHISSLQGDITGTWSTPDGKRKFPLVLNQIQTDLEARFPYEIRLIADAQPSQENDHCPTPPLVSAIRLYKNGKLLQNLETESQGTCNLFTPELIDANFDGWPDLTINQFLPAGPNMPAQTWLYDKASQRFIDAPTDLQDISSAEFDSEQHIIYSYWRSSCCEHGVTTYIWKGDNVQELESESSYVMPILDSNEQRLCYMMPSYNNGFIEFANRIEQANDGQLKLHQIDPKECETIEDGVAPDPMKTRIDIWKPTVIGRRPHLLRTERTAWVRTDTANGYHYCPELPFFDNGRIRRIVLSKNSQNCVAEPPLKD